MRSPEISIIIVSFNTCDLLSTCLDRIKKMDISLSYEVIVVDNASSDGTQEMIISKYPNIKHIFNKENRMYAKANNQGVQATSGKYLLFLNSDAFIRANAVEEMSILLHTNHKAAIVGPKMLNIDGTLQSKGNPPPSVCFVAYRVLGLWKLPFFVQRFSFPNFCWHDNKIRKVGWVSGSCMMVRRSVFEEIGGFWEKLFFYGEEVELCNRALKAGYQVWYCPKAEVEHIGGASTSEDARKVINNQISRLKNFARVQTRIIGNTRAFMWALIVTFSLYIKLTGAILFSNKKKQANYRSAIAWEKKTLIFFFRRFKKRLGNESN